MKIIKRLLNYLNSVCLAALLFYSHPSLKIFFLNYFFISSIIDNVHRFDTYHTIDLIELKSRSIDKIFPTYEKKIVYVRSIVIANTYKLN